MYRFLIVVEKSNGNYSAYSPDLPGCVATGESREEVERKMHEAVQMRVQALREDGLPIPESLVVCGVHRSLNGTAVGWGLRDRTGRTSSCSSTLNAPVWA